jgi:hypothetical protein
MKFTALIFVLLLIGCGSSLDIPPTEESKHSIALMKPRLDSLDRKISAEIQGLPRGHDLITQTRTLAVNTLLHKVTNSTQRDVHIDFLATRPLWKEDKSLLGVQFSNVVNVDTGTMDIDLKKFVFTGISNNTIYAQIEIEGSGFIKASGTYAGVSARVSPQIHFYLDEQILFSVAAADSDYIRLNPIPKTLRLKTKTTITLLGWSIPYYKEILLLTTDLIKPILIPSAVTSEIVFPVPAAQYGSQRMQFVKRYLRFTRSTVRANNNVLEYRSNIDFDKP